MAICEICGSDNEEGSIFCSTCGFNSDTEVNKEEPLKKQTRKQHTIDYKPFRLQKQHSQTQGPYYVALTFGVFIIAFSISILIPDSVQIILPITFTVIGVSIVVLASRQSPRDLSFFVAIILVVLTVGLSLMIQVAVYIILPTGFMAVGLTLCYYYSLSSSRHPSFFAAIAFTILTIGLALIIESATYIILPAGSMVVALIVTFYLSSQSSRDPLLFVAITLCIIMFSAALAFSSAVDIIFSVGFILIALVIISWALKHLSGGSSQHNRGSNYN